MERAQLLEALEAYKTSFVEEKGFISRFKSLLNNFDNCYNRSLLSGHITASAWIIDESGSFALLVHHKKLNRWLQPGGHADGDENIVAAAMKEAREETGLKSLSLINESIFDLDIHLIPNYKNVKAHFHYDIRYIFTASKIESYVISDESNNLAWIELDEIQKVSSNNNSMRRMVLKTKLIFK